MKRVISTDQAPAAIGPYSQAIAVVPGELVFLSGQIPLDAKTGQLVQGDVVVQTERVLDNLAAVLQAAGCTFADVVKCGVFVKDMNDFPKVNEAYAKRFAKDPPARATVEVARLPKDVLVEIDAIAVKARA
jgi:2-iminobutanoate/2-iminopropanoate deaminase